jgi:DNA-binding transcriptional regulator GbsR (MarR family)
MSDHRGHDSSRLLEAQRRFVHAWGQMGSTWGISRTMAEVHALLYILAQPLCADEVMERLDISRGNASMSLRALVDWGVVRREHRPGERREYFSAEGDVWSMLQAILRERIRREIHPALAALYETRDLTGHTPHTPHTTTAPTSDAQRLTARLDAMIDLLRTFDHLGQKLLDLSAEDLRATAMALADNDH